MRINFDEGCEAFEFMASDGLLLAGRRYGDRDAHERLPVVCLPGLTRNSKDFHGLALALSSHEKHPRRVLALDYRGRGQSAYDRNPDNYNPLIEAADVITACEAAGFEDIALIGTSRGGLIAMLLAALRPSMLKQVVLNDVGPEIDGVGWARIKTSLDRMKTPATWDEAIAILHEAASPQFTSLSDKDWEIHARATFRDVDGKPARDFDDGLLKSIRSQRFDEELPTFWPQFAGLRRVPVLAIRGGNSDLLSEETLERMASEHPGMQSITVEGQGHAPMLHTAGLPKKIDRFLERTAPSH